MRAEGIILIERSSVIIPVQRHSAKWGRDLARIGPAERHVLRFHLAHRRRRRAAIAARRELPIIEVEQIAGA
ncbi:hypothetical protein D3C73_1369370 [compost metagenome]